MKRLLLKLSGEQLSGSYDYGLDPEVATYYAAEIKKARDAGTETVVLVGGGNMVRGAKTAGQGIRKVTAHYMGMLSGIINAMALADIFNDQGLESVCLSHLYAEQAVESYSFRAAEAHLAAGRVVLVAGGIARPYFTHDTAAVSIGLELECEAVLKGTKVDGIYTADPVKHPEATRFETISFQDALANPDITVMDKSALGLAMEHTMPIIVFNPMTADNLRRIAAGETVGTRVG